MKIKKLLFSTCICALAASLIISLSSCKNENADNNTDDTKDPADSTSEPIETDSLVYADKDTVLALYRAAEQPQSTITHSLLSFTASFSENSLYTSGGTLVKTADGALHSTETIDDIVTLEEYLKDGEYLSISDNTASKVALSSETEISSVSKTISDKYFKEYKIDDFSSVSAMDNEDGSFTLIGSNVSDEVKTAASNDVKAYLDMLIPDYADYSVYDVGYQLTVNGEGIVISYVLFISINVTTPEDASESDETVTISLPIDIGSFYTLSFIAAVVSNEDEVNLPDTADIEITEFSYDEYFTK